MLIVRQYCAFSLPMANRSAFFGLIYTLLAIFCLLFIANAVFFVEFWARGYRTLRKEQVGIGMALLSCVVEIAWLAYDPFYWRGPVEQDSLFASYCLINLSSTFIVLGWFVILLIWLEIRSLMSPKSHGQMMFWVAFGVAFVVSVPIPIVLAYVSTHTSFFRKADLVYYAFLFAFGLGVGLGLIISVLLTLRDLKKFDHHRQRIRRLAWQVLWQGVVIVLVLVVLAILALVDAKSVSAFLALDVGMATLTAAIANGSICFILRYKKWREAGKRTTNTTEQPELGDSTDYVSMGSPRGK